MLVFLAAPAGLSMLKSSLARAELPLSSVKAPNCRYR